MESNLNNFKNYVTDPPPSMSSLPRQSSIYSLTFDEFQTTVGGIGKDYGSMNMDELLKSIWSAEDVQNTGSTSNNGVVGANHSSNNTNNHQENNTYLTRQGSLTLPRTLSQKTVDEVWRDMSKEYSNGAKDKNIGFGIPNREPTLGEVTLEEFLVRAGVVREDAVPAPKITTFTDLSSTSNTNGSGLGYGFQTQQGKGTFGSVDSNGMQSGNARPTMHRPEILPKPPNFAYATALEMSSGNNQMSTVVESLALQNGGLGMIGLGANGVTIATNSPVLSSDALTKSNGDNMSSVSPVPCVFSSGLRGRKSAPLEKVIERRQRRMIKNRESAARSRARKQAYTTELEEEVARLKEENEELRKKQAQIIEMQKNQAIEMMRQQSGAKRRCLRRTQTALW